MNRGLELFIRMHCEKTPSIQLGRSILTADVILGVPGKLQHDYPMGSDAIMWKWLHDLPAFERDWKRRYRRMQNERMCIGTSSRSRLWCLRTSRF